MTELKNKEEAAPWSFVFILFLVGVLFVVMAATAVQEAGEKFPLELINKQRSELAAWPHVQGQLDRIDIYSETYQRTRNPSGTDYWPEVKYHYSVGKQKYEGNCLRIKLAYQPDIYYCDDPVSGLSAAKNKLKAFLPADLPEHVSQDKLARKIRSYYPNSKVDVYYDPRNPARSQLDNNWEEQSWLDYYSNELIMGVFGSTLAVMMFAACGVCVWVQFFSKNKSKSGIVLAAQVSNPHVELPHAISPEDQWKVDSPVSLSEETKRHTQD